MFCLKIDRAKQTHGAIVKFIELQRSLQLRHGLSKVPHSEIGPSQVITYFTSKPSLAMHLLPSQEMLQSALVISEIACKDTNLQPQICQRLDFRSLDVASAESPLKIAVCRFRPSCRLLNRTNIIQCHEVMRIKLQCFVETALGSIQLVHGCQGDPEAVVEINVLLIEPQTVPIFADSPSQIAIAEIDISAEIERNGITGHDVDSIDKSSVIKGLTTITENLRFGVSGKWVRANSNDHFSPSATLLQIVQELFNPLANTPDIAMCEKNHKFSAVH